MASSSTRTWKYDVFPSFSGEDVRKSFLSHFLEKLQGKSIITFIDNRIERSRTIELELLLAIRQSRISIVVFSKKYASSTWCLNELAEIHDCHEESDQMVIPIFYEVDPSHVRKQTGEFGKAFDVTCKGKTEDGIKRWKKALSTVAGLAGYDSQNWSGEAEAIEQISKDVLNKLLFTPSDDFRDFVGINAHIEAIMDSKLCLESGGVRMVGIVGPSGIGKTTIARALFSRLSSQFDHRAFVSYKRAVQEKKIADFGMKLSWANHFLSEILCQKDIKIESLGAVEQRLKHRKVLIVLDDVDEIELLETLVGQTGWFGFGSRIIVVTQDKALLKSHKIKFIYEVQFPSREVALQMFCQSGFGKTSPPDGFMELAAAVAKLAGNLPLGLNVLGSSLRGKDKEHWVEMMPRLRNGLNGKIQKTLRVSYDGLDEKDDQDIFLYIACLFNGERVKYIKNLLGVSVTIGLQLLADKSFIRLTPPCNTVHMHTLLEKLGREIVRAESTTNPGKRRFLVDAKDISNVFEDYTGTDSVLAIYCNTSDIEEPFFVNEKSFKQMRNLQFIKVYNEQILYHHSCEVCWGHKTGEVRLNLPQGLIYLPHKLKLLHWDEYPAKYIPSSFSAEYLVELKMRNSRLEKLWEGTQPLRSLKVMNIAGSRDLKEIPDLSNATNLEILNLCNCTSLVTLPSSIRNLKKLIDLSMAGCSKLEVLPTDVNLECLNYLDLRDCSRLKSFPRISRNISRLYLDGTAMEEDDCLWIGNLLGLTLLDWVNCPLRCMPSNFNPEHLTQLIMRKSKLEKLWEGYQSLRRLMVIDFKNSKNLKEIPDLSKATNLESMDLSGCKSLREFPDLSKATSLNWVKLSGCESLKDISNLPKATNIWNLDLNNCISLVMLPSSIQHLDKLETMFMRECTSLEVLPTNINLVSLKCLDLRGCSRLRNFPQLSTSIEKLYLDDTAIEEVPSWIENIAGLTRLEMRGCQKLRTISATIWNLKYLNHVDFTDCGGITSVSDTSLVKTVAELHAESVENHPMVYPSWFFSNTEFLFCDCFNLDRDAQEFILQSDSRFVVLPGKEVPTYFTHRTHGSSLTVPLPQSSLSQNHLRFTACVDFGAEVDVHWKFRGVTGMCTIDPGKYFCKMDHLVVFYFGFCPQEEVDGPPPQLDCTNVEFEFKFRSAGFLYCTEDLQTIPIFHGKIKGCGVRALNASPSLVANDRNSETEYTDQSSRESDEEAERCKKRMRMTVETSEDNSNFLCGQTAGNSGSRALNLELSLGLIGPSAQVASRSKVPSPSISSRNFHGDEASLNLFLSSFDPCLEGESLYFDPMITEQLDTWTSSEDPSFSPQLTKYFR